MGILNNLPNPFKREKNTPEDVPPVSILVIGDDMSTAQDVARMLSTNGYEVSTSSDINDGIACLDSGACDLIIGDFKMPEEDAKKFVRLAHIRRGQKSLPPFVLLWDEPNDELVADELAVSDVIRKPVDLASLLKVVENLTKRPDVNSKQQPKK
jgi:DNA-binding response OmpR family regulator